MKIWKSLRIPLQGTARDFFALWVFIDTSYMAPVQKPESNLMNFIKVKLTNQVTGSTGSEVCFWISASPVVKFKFTGKEGWRPVSHSLELGSRADSGGCCNDFGVKPTIVSVSGVTVMESVSSDAAVIWMPLDKDSWDFLEVVRSIWSTPCLDILLSIRTGETGYMLVTAGAPVPYRADESIGSVLGDTVL